MNWFDASSWVGIWPFTMTAETSVAKLAASLARFGVRDAAVSPLNAVLGPEPQSANRALLASLSADLAVRIWPVPVIDPSLPGWERDLDEMLTDQRVRAVKIIPNYHGYRASDEQVVQLARQVAKAGRVVCVQVRILDERAQHSLMQVPGVPLSDVSLLAKSEPRCRFLVCGAFRAELPLIADRGNISIELSSVESSDTLQTTLDLLGEDRILAGTHAPVYDIAPGMAKVASRGDLLSAMRRVGYENARELLDIPGEK